MKKSLILLGMLSIGYTYAQSTNPYKERVGINTEAPSATLNVKTKNNTASPKNLELENAGGTKLMTVLNGGNVGINTDAPTEKLHINEGNLKVLRTSGGAGPFLELNNPSKSGDTQANYWRLYNATGAYGDVLLFYPYNSKNAGLHSSAAFSFTDDAKFGIGLNKPEEKLHVASGNVKINDLPSNAGGALDKVVVVDNTGVLKTVERSTIVPTNTTNGIQNTAKMVCNATNAGKVNYTTIQKDGKTLGIFGFCMQRDTQYVWAYMAGGSNIFGTSADGAEFGVGL